MLNLKDYYGYETVHQDGDTPTAIATERMRLESQHGAAHYCCEPHVPTIAADVPEVPDDDGYPTELVPWGLPLQAANRLEKKGCLTIRRLRRLVREEQPVLQLPMLGPTFLKQARAALAKVDAAKANSSPFPNCKQCRGENRAPTSP